MTNADLAIFYNNINDFYGSQSNPLSSSRFIVSPGCYITIPFLHGDQGRLHLHVYYQNRWKKSFTTDSIDELIANFLTFYFNLKLWGKN